MKVHGAPYSTSFESRTSMKSSIVIPRDLCLSEEVMIIKDHEFSKALDKVQGHKQVLIVVLINYNIRELIEWLGTKAKLTHKDFLLYYCWDHQSEEHKVREWINGNSNKKFLITDEWTVAGYEFDTTILLVKDDQINLISKVCQRARANLIVCQVSTSPFSPYQVMEVMNEREEPIRFPHTPLYILFGLIISCAILFVIGAFAFGFESHMGFSGCIIIIGIAILIFSLCYVYFCYVLKSMSEVRQISRQSSRQTRCQQLPQ